MTSKLEMKFAFSKHTRLLLPSCSSGLDESGNVTYRLPQVSKDSKKSGRTGVDHRPYCTGFVDGALNS